MSSNPLSIYLHTPSLSRFRATRAGVLALFCAGVFLQVASTARAQSNYFWDNNGGTSGSERSAVPLYYNPKSSCFWYKRRFWG